MIDTDYRSCPRCGNTKKIEEYKVSKLSGNRSYICYECVLQYIKERQPPDTAYTKCPTCGIKIPQIRFYDEWGVKHDECLACRVIGPGEISKDFNGACDERAEKYIAALEKVIQNKKNWRISIYDD